MSLSTEDRLTTLAPSAFFSYSRADSEFALKLAADLEAAGCSVWIDQRHIALGERWDRAIESALNRCPILIVVLSPSSVDSNNVLDEVSFALEKQKTVLPVMHKDCVVPFRLLRFQYADFRSDYGRGLRNLVATLSAIRPASVAPQPPPEPLGQPLPAPTDSKIEALPTETIPGETGIPADAEFAAPTLPAPGEEALPAATVEPAERVVQENAEPRTAPEPVVPLAPVVISPDEPLLAPTEEKELSPLSPELPKPVPSPTPPDAKPVPGMDSKGKPVAKPVAKPEAKKDAPVWAQIVAVLLALGGLGSIGLAVYGIVRGVSGWVHNKYSDDPAVLFGTTDKDVESRLGQPSGSTHGLIPSKDYAGKGLCFDFTMQTVSSIYIQPPYDQPVAPDISLKAPRATIEARYGKGTAVSVGSMPCIEAVGPVSFIAYDGILENGRELLIHYGSDDLPRVIVMSTVSYTK